MNREKFFKLQGIVSLIAAILILVGTLFLPVAKLTVSDYNGLKNTGSVLAVTKRIASLAASKNVSADESKKIAEYVKIANDAYENRHERTEKEIFAETEQILENTKITANIDDELKMRVLYYSIVTTEEEIEKITLDWNYRDKIREQGVDGYYEQLINALKTNSDELEKLLENTKLEYYKENDGVSYSFYLPSPIEMLANASKTNALTDLESKEYTIICYQKDIDNTKHEIQRLNYEASYKISKATSVESIKEIRDSYDEKIEELNAHIAACEKEINYIENAIKKDADKYINALNDVSFAVLRYSYEYKKEDLLEYCPIGTYTLRCGSYSEHNMPEYINRMYPYSERYYAPYSNSEIDQSARIKYELYLGSSNSGTLFSAGSGGYTYNESMFAGVNISLFGLPLFLIFTAIFFKKGKKEKEVVLYGKVVKEESKPRTKNIYSYGIRAFSAAMLFFIGTIIVPTLCSMITNTEFHLSWFGIIITVISVAVLVLNFVGGRIIKPQGEGKKAINIVQLFSLIQLVLLTVALGILVNGGILRYTLTYFGRVSHLQSFEGDSFISFSPMFMLFILVVIFVYLYKFAKLASSTNYNFAKSKDNTYAGGRFGFIFLIILSAVLLLFLIFSATVSPITGRFIAVIVLVLSVLATRIAQKILLNKFAPTLLVQDMRKLVGAAYYEPEQETAEETQK